MILSLCNWAILDLIFLKKCQLEFRLKLRILFCYILLTVKYLVFRGFLKREVVSERFLDFKVFFFTYDSFYHLFREIFVHQPYYFNFENGTDGPVIVDCGSNIGLATLYFKFLYPDSEIYCFEPDGQTFDLLKKNIETNDLKNVHLKKAAVYLKDGEAKFYVDKNDPASWGMSLLPGRLSDPLVRRVPTVALSRFIRDEVDYMKVDIEGAETVVIKELADAGVIENIKEMVIEYHHQVFDTGVSLPTLLGVLEDNLFQYQISSIMVPLYRRDKKQDVMIYAYRQV
ncbi:FkbM family methyltransferase [Patescibacteria group bacterium]|nr:FkbM family methyltransferase [Patescibacteria group bacterium]MBU1868793.1 FkbM family methyltransferase [Patescibacteria group bacterium]